MRSAIVWEQYSAVREQLQRRIAEKIQRQMSSLVGNMESADLLLVAADGKKLPAHECILRARAPGFYQRHVEATVAAMGPRQEGKLREVAIGDIDSAGLEFFIHSVYTEDEIAQFPTETEEMDDRLCDCCRRVMQKQRIPNVVIKGDSSRGSNRSFAMDESTELDFPLGGADERSLEEETPTSGRPPLGYMSQSGYSLQTSPRHHLANSMTSSSSSVMTSSIPGPMTSSSFSGPHPIGVQFSGHAPSTSQMTSSVPQMTSFRDLATGSPMNSSVYSLGGRSEVADIPEEEEESSGGHQDRRPKHHGISMSKFIRLDSIETADPLKEYMERKRSSGGPKQIFPMFIGLSDDPPPQPVYQEPSRYGGDTLRPGRIIMSKRLSMTSLTSLTSIDMTPNQDGQTPTNDRAPASKLASELLQMYLNNEDTDVIIKTESGELHAHRCILSATSPFFRQQLLKTKKIELKGFSRNSVHFLLSFLYGGLTTIPEEVDVWEVISLATHLNHKDLADVVVLHLKATKCHWFHRPCATCVSSVFDALPQMATIRCLRGLYEEALAWQAKHFARIWKGRVFIHLNERWQKEGYEAVIQQMDDETLIDTILGCERLQVALPRSKAEAAVSVLSMVDDVLDVAMQYLVHSFHLVVTSRAFQQQGKGLALNLGILEDLLPTIIHSLSADVAIKTFKGLGQLLMEIQSVPPSPKRGLSIPIDEYSSRFASLVRRMFEIVDKHLLHYAASVVKADAWHLLNQHEQARINETGLFVELRQPKAPPPRLSSLSRSYKRSASVGVQFTQGINNGRSRSIDRGRPLSTIQQTATTMEVEMKPEATASLEPEKPEQTESPRRSRKDQLPPPATEEKKTAPKTEPPRPPSVSKIAKPTSRQNSNERKEKEEIRKTEEAREKKKEKGEEPVRENSNLESKEPRPTSRVESPRTKEKSATELTKKSPMKKKVIESDEGRLERQGTHTILTVDRTKTAHLPGPEQSPVKITEKPKSVVKPMVKDPPLAAAAQRTITRTVPRPTSATATSTGTKPSSIKSSIPKSVSSTKSAVPSKVPSRIPAQSDQKRPGSGPTRTAKSPNNTPRTRQANSIDRT